MAWFQNRTGIRKCNVPHATVLPPQEDLVLLIFTAKTTKIRTGYIPIMESLDKRKILDSLNQENLLEGLPNGSEVSGPESARLRLNQECIFLVSAKPSVL